MKNDTLKNYTLKKAAWIKRICSTALDVGAGSFLAAKVAFGIREYVLLEHWIETFLIVAISLGYYLLFELTIGRTPGKMLFGLRLLDRKGNKPPFQKRVTRGIMRIIGPFALLSWRRITLLDLLSGMRVYSLDSSLVKSEDKDADPPAQKGGWR